MMGVAQRPRPSPVPTWIVFGAFGTGHADPLHELIRAARDGDRTAAGCVIDGAREAAPLLLPGVMDAVVIPVPGHAAGTISPLVRAASLAIAQARGWWYAAASLRRRGPVPEAKAGGTRDIGMEASTLEWSPPLSGGRIILVDDVLRTGMSVRVCAEAIRSAGDPREVVAVAIAAVDVPRAPGAVRLIGTGLSAADGALPQGQDAGGTSTSRSSFQA
jgi:adenine/guanine phosphoribosyltransferase-like PRPP-binding protein